MYLAPKENTKVVSLYRFMWNFLLLEEEVWERGGVAEGLIYFSSSQREELSTAHMPMPKEQPNLPLSIWADQTQMTSHNLGKSAVRYKGTRERKTSLRNVQLHIITSD